jgi:hypothetical protein
MSSRGAYGHANGFGCARPRWFLEIASRDSRHISFVVLGIAETKVCPACNHLCGWLQAGHTLENDLQPELRIERLSRPDSRGSVVVSNRV